MSNSQDLLSFALNPQKQRIELNLTNIQESIDTQNPVILRQADQLINSDTQALYTTLQRDVKKQVQQLEYENQPPYKKWDDDNKEGMIEQREDVEIQNKKNEGIIEVNGHQLIEENEKKEVQKQTSFSYNLLEQNSIEQEEWCCAIAFNQDQSIVIAGCNQNIKVFEHNFGKLDQIQLLSGPRKSVLCLNFMKNTNHIVSGGGENAIIIWQMIEHHKWIIQQKLVGHLDPVFFLLLSNNDDLIISCSHDSTINFWIKWNQWICIQTISDHQDQVYQLSFNDQQNQLISCSKDSYILVIEQSTLDKQWQVTQKIKVDQFGCRLSFINDNYFLFQPFCKEQIHVYEMDCQSKLFTKTKEITVECGSTFCEFLFPLQYLKKKCILINKNGKTVNIMSKKDNGDIIVSQSIGFDCTDIFGQLSNDGEYLVMWNYKSKVIEIRKYKEL